jgi:hypothetical protein
MEEECVEMYGMTGTFFSTNKAYHIPYPIERDFHPFLDKLSDNESDSDDGSNERAVAPAVAPATSTDDGEEQAAVPVTSRLRKSRQSRQKLCYQGANSQDAGKRIRG